MIYDIILSETIWTYYWPRDQRNFGICIMKTIKISLFLIISKNCPMGHFYQGEVWSFLNVENLLMNNWRVSNLFWRRSKVKEEHFMKGTQF